MRVTEEGTELEDEKQQKYRSGVGSLLYLLKHSRPDLPNAVRELSKVMDQANEGHYKALLRTIKYVSDTRNRELELKPTGKGWELKAFTDSDFAGDADTRRSVSGFIIYLNGCPISWRSKGQKSVTLSSTEAEYVALSEVTGEILFIAGIMKFIGEEPDYPIIISVDNIGAIYLAGSASTSSRTKHIDTRYHFVREYIEEGKVKIIFVKSEENEADIMTKNLGNELYNKHVNKIFNIDNRKGVEKDIVELKDDEG